MKEIKKTSLILIFSLFLFFTLGASIIKEVYSQTKTASPSVTMASPTISAEDKEINSLKEKIATKVAELREKNNIAVSGEIQKISKNSIFIKTKNEKEYEVKIDDTLTKYFQIIGLQKKEIKLSDLEKGDYIIATGVINDKTVTANFVYTDEQYLVMSGKIAEVNKDSYYLKVATSEKDDITLDIETLTKMMLLNIKTIELERAGFSKLKEGDTIHFVVKITNSLRQLADGGDTQVNRYSAQKLLIIPQEYFMK